MKNQSENVTTVRTSLPALVLLLLLSATWAQAQTFTVLHTFIGPDGASPKNGLTIDRQGNLYGTTSSGGVGGYGTVFRLTHKNSGWIFQTLYSFHGGTDGAEPYGRLSIGANGSLYGTTIEGGNHDCNGHGCGTVFNLRPPADFCRSASCPWNETVLYRFDNTYGLNQPGGDLAFDAEGNIYGSASNIFELAQSSGSWNVSAIAGTFSEDGLTFDSTGNLYGTTFDTIYQLTPGAYGWVQNVVHNLYEQTEGAGPGGLIMDSAGNLYGATFVSGPNHGGAVFELSPAGGAWNFHLLYAFSGGGGPWDGTLSMDPDGNLYGTTNLDGAYSVGNVFKLTSSYGSWSYTDLHDFHPLGSDGCNPAGSTVLDANGTLYGTTPNCGSGNPGLGVVWEVTPN